MEKSLVEKIFYGTLTLCFALTTLLWGMHTAQNAEEHKKFLLRLEKVEIRASQHDIDLAIIAYKAAHDEKWPTH